ncbi:MAG: two-component regulator propeller domain-containing protein [Gammaproteobacteria bacterium]
MTTFKTAILVTAVTGVALAAGYYAGSRNSAQDTVGNAAVEAGAAQELPAGSTPQAGTAQAPYHGLDTVGHTAPQAPDALPPQSGQAHLNLNVDPDAKFTHFRVGQRNVKRIMADGDTMWVGTSGGAIRYNLKTDDYRLFDLRSGLLANGIFYIGKLQDRIALGTYGGGLSVYDEQKDKWDIYNIPQGLGDAFVYDALEMPNGDIWIATWSGANRVRGGALDDRDKWDLYTVENTDGGLPNDWVYGLARGKNGEVWMATEGGLARFKDGKWSNWNHEKGQGAPYELVKDHIQFKNDPAQYSKHHTRQKSEMGLQDVDVAYNPNYIVALQVDGDGTVWAGTWGGGLARFDGTTWKNYTMADGLPANHVFSLHQDPEGRIWVGTSNGLAILGDDKFQVYTTADGLFSDIVFSIANANDGSAWIGSFGGVARIAQLP